MDISLLFSKQFVALLPPIVGVTMLLSSLFASFRNKLDVKCTLVAFWIATTVLYACHAMYFNDMVEKYPLSSVLYVFCNLLVFPLFLYYICVIAQEKKYSLLWFVLPALLGGAATLACYFACGDRYGEFIQRYLYEKEYVTSDNVLFVTCLVHDFCRLLFAVEVISVVYFGVRVIRTFNKRLDDFYSNTEEKSMNKITVLLKCMLAISLFSFVINILGRQFFENAPEWLGIPALLFSVALVFLGTVCLQQQFTIHDLLLVEQRNEYALEMLEDTEGGVSYPMKKYKSSKDLWEKINRTILDNRLFTDSNFNVSDLSTRIFVNRTYVQLVIKEYSGMTFHEYVNTIRMAYAEELKEKNPKRLIKEIIQDAGFASPSAYYRALKKNEESQPEPANEEEA